MQVRLQGEKEEQIPWDKSIPQYFKFLLFKNQLTPRKVQDETHHPFTFFANKEAGLSNQQPKENRM